MNSEYQNKNTQNTNNKSQTKLKKHKEGKKRVSNTEIIASLLENCEEYGYSHRSSDMTVGLGHENGNNPYVSSQNNNSKNYSNNLTVNSYPPRDQSSLILQ